MLFLVIEHLSNLIDCLLLQYLLDSHLKTNRRRFQRILFIIVLVTGVSIFKSFPLTTSLSVIVMLCSFTFYSKIYYDSSFELCLFWSSVFVAIVMVSDEMTYLITSLLSPINLITLENPGIPRIVGMGIYYIFLTSGCIYASRFDCSLLTMSPLSVFLFYGAFICGILFFYTQIDMTVLISQDTTIAPDIFHSACFASILMVLFFIILILLVTYTSNLFTKYQAAQIQQLNIAQERQQFHAYQDTANLIRQWRHDYHHHLQSIAGFAQKNDIDAVLQYLNELTPMFSTSMAVPSTGNSVLDVILSAKSITAEAKGIQINRSIYMPEQSPLTPVELSSLLGNMLDNAIEACQQVPLSNHSCINLSIKPRQGSLLISMTNPASGIYHFDSDHQLLSTKNTDGHGLGLLRIRQIVESHDGFMDVCPGADSFSIHVIIPMLTSDIHDNSNTTDKDI